MQFVYWLQVALCTTAVLLTGSRAAVVTLATALIIVPVLAARWSRVQRLSALAVFLIAAVGSAYIVPRSEWTRLMGISHEVQEGTLSHRTQIWAAGMEVFRENPLVGVGAAGFQDAIITKLDVPYVAHNTFISVLVELGVIGAMLLLGLLLAMFYCGLRLPALEKRLWVMMLLVWSVGVTSGVWEYRKTTWLIFGLLAAHASAITTERARDAQELGFALSASRA